MTRRDPANLMTGIPPGFVVQQEVRRWRGCLRLCTRSAPPALLVQAFGYIGPSLIRADLAFAEGFGRIHSSGWDYVVDTTGMRCAHPLNPLWLRRIRGLPNLRRYIVIAPFAATRFAIRMARCVVQPDAVVSSLEAWEQN